MTRITANYAAFSPVLLKYRPFSTTCGKAVGNLSKTGAVVDRFEQKGLSSKSFKNPPKRYAKACEQAKQRQALANTAFGKVIDSIDTSTADTTSLIEKVLEW